MTDEGLMHCVQLDDRQQLSALMRRYANPLLTFLTRMTGDHHQSEELFQDVFLAVWNQRREYIFPRPLRPWLFAIAVNKCKSDLRTTRRRPVVLNDAEVAGALSDAQSPAESAVATETATIVEQAVLSLPDLQRQVAVLRIWNELSYQAIGQILGRPEGTIRSHMFHAVNAMRKYLEPRLRDVES